MTAAKSVLQNHKATADFQLHFNSNGSGNDNYSIVGFTDSDWASESTDRKSQGGHVFSHITMVAPYHYTLGSKT
jgi:hypothetical protein